MDRHRLASCRRASRRHDGRIALYLVVMAAMWLVSPMPAAAHDMTETRIVLVLRLDDAFHAEVTADLDALALGADPTVDSAVLARRLLDLDPVELEALVERLRGTLQRRLRILADGERIPFEVSFPGRGQTPRPDEPPSVLGLIARLDGRLPIDTETVSVRASRAFPPVELVVLREHGVDVTTVEQGTPSDPIPLRPQATWAASGLGWSTAESAGLAGARALSWLGFGHLLWLLAMALAAPGIGRAGTAGGFVGLTVATLGSGFGALSLPSAVALPAAGFGVVLGGLLAAWTARRPDGWIDRLVETPPGAAWWFGACSLVGLVHGSILGGRVADLGIGGPPPDGAAAAFVAGALGAAVACWAVARLAADGLHRRSRRLAVALALGIVLAASIALPGTVETVTSDPSEASPSARDEGEKTLENGRFTLFLQPNENPRRNHPSS